MRKRYILVIIINLSGKIIFFVYCWLLVACKDSLVAAFAFLHQNIRKVVRTHKWYFLQSAVWVVSTLIGSGDTLNLNYYDQICWTFYTHGWWVC